MAEASKMRVIYAEDGDVMEVPDTQLGQAIAKGWSPFPFTPAYGHMAPVGSAGSRLLSGVGSEVKGMAGGLYHAVADPPDSTVGRILPGYTLAKRLVIDPETEKLRSTVRAFRSREYTKGALGAAASLDPFAPDVTKLYEQSARGDIAGAIGRGAVDAGALVGPKAITKAARRIGFGAHTEGGPIFDSIRERIGDNDIVHDDVLDALDNTMMEAGGKTSIPPIVKNLRKHLVSDHEVPFRNPQTGVIEHLDRGPGITFREGLSWKTYLGDAVNMLKDRPKLQRNLIQIKDALDKSLAATAEYHGLGKEFATANELWSRGKRLGAKAEFATEYGVGGPLGYGLGRAVGHPLGGAFLGMYAGRQLGRQIGRGLGEKAAHTPIRVPRSLGGVAVGGPRQQEPPEELEPLPE